MGISVLICDICQVVWTPEYKLKALELQQALGGQSF